MHTVVSLLTGASTRSTMPESKAAPRLTPEMKPKNAGVLDIELTGTWLSPLA